MIYPIWSDYEYNGESYTGWWKGTSHSGKPVMVPAVYSQEDVEGNSPASIEALRQRLKELALQTYYEVVGMEKYGLFDRKVEVHLGL